MNNLKKIKDLIEKNPVSFATMTVANKPNIIIVGYVKVVSANQVLITDNYMERTIEDIAKNNNVCLAVCDLEMRGCKLIGKAKYFVDGKWKNMLNK